jgi:hypothetical protein
LNRSIDLGCGSSPPSEWAARQVHPRKLPPLLPYPEQYTAWHLTHTQRIMQQVTLTKADLMGY